LLFVVTRDVSMTFGCTNAALVRFAEDDRHVLQRARVGGLCSCWLDLTWAGNTLTR
jgi:hypothetical protein